MMLLASEMLCEGSAVSTLKAQQKSAETASSSVGWAHVGAQLSADCDTDEMLSQEVVALWVKSKQLDTHDD